LRLEAREVTGLTPHGPTRWRWALTDASGNVIADHQVLLSPSDWQFEAFADLTRYLSWHVAPDRRAGDEARIVAEVGEWIGTRVLGPIAAELVRRRPSTVRVTITAPDLAFPEGASRESRAAETPELLFRPLELAHVNGKPLSVQDVTFVMQPPGTADGTAPSDARPIGGRLRVLGLFSLPEGGQPLNLRHERHSLVRLFNGIAAAGKAADVRVLQYGVTRDRLREVLEEAEGWDIVHISGHGLPGELLLETPVGHPDRIGAADLAGLLDLAAGRIKLVTVAACWSAAQTAAEQRRLLGLPVQDQSSPERPRGSRSPATASGTLATELATRLGCAVLAMRYPVDDEFAIALAGKLYGPLADKGHDLPRAVGMALRQLMASGTGYPPLSVATPTLFGWRAVDLRLAAPPREGPLRYDAATRKMAGFSPPPERFVGRTGVMARASAALAAESGVPGVLLHGMPGGGKTACALELAYGHEHAFERLVWYKAPDEGIAIDGALTDFALTLERYLDGFQMAHVLVSAETLAGFLPRLTELMKRCRLLIVIDNAESLLTESGQWRDDNWNQVIGALAGHAGLGRVLLTSRRVPADWAGAGGATGTGSPGKRFQAATGEAAPAGTPPMETLSVDVLSPDEALLLARELPNLSALKLGQVPGIGSTVSRQLARNAIALAQGHPKLLELAEGQAANSDHLLELVKTGDQEWRKLGEVPDGFFGVGGGPAATGEDYLRVIAAWAQAVTDTLTPGERDLFWFLCCLEERDRARDVLDDKWAGLWTRLERDGQPPALKQALATIAERGLAAIRAETGDAAEAYAIHPRVAAAGRDHAGQSFRDAVDAEAAAYWHAMHRYASGAGGTGSVHTGLMVRAGLAAIPYYLRHQQWDAAVFLLESAFVRDPSRASAAAVLPAIRQITRHDPSNAVILARVLQEIDPAAAEAMLRAAMDDAVARGDYRAASTAATRLADLCRASGRLAEALHFTEQKADHTRQAGLGPWTRLADQVRRLKVLPAMGQAAQVLDEVRRLRDLMDALPATSTAGDLSEAISP
jgi:hypothetical protein